MKHCFPKTQYYVSCRWTTFADGSGRNYVRTASLGKARYCAKKLKRKYRQIDVRVRGEKTPRVLPGSWL